jgi:23S rRNA (adenine2503-C2)-methyltransferase
MSSGRRLMPINRKYPLELLMKACREFPLDDRERLTFEYVMLAGINDSDDRREAAGQAAQRDSGKDQSDPTQSSA